MCEDTASTQLEDVYPANTHTVMLNDLRSATKYKVRVMAFNNIGESNYTEEEVVVRTNGEAICSNTRL